MQTLTVSYVVFTPIYGYNGMGYARMPFLEKRFGELEDAIKWARRCDKVYESEGKSGPTWDAFYIEMTDNISYCIKGKSLIRKQTLISEEIEWN